MFNYFGKISFLIFYSFFLFSESKYIIIPLKRYNFNYNETEGLINNIYSNVHYTELKIGEPKQTIISFINMTSDSNFGIYSKSCDKEFYLTNANVNKDYTYKNSSTFYQVDKGDMTLGVKDLLIKDGISFYTNFELTEEIKVENLSILYNPNNVGYILDDVGYDFIIEWGKRASCAYIGLKLEVKSQTNKNNLLDQLKERDIISSTAFTFVEVNKENKMYKENNIDSLLILGDEIYDIFNQKDISQYVSDKYKKEIIKQNAQKKYWVEVSKVFFTMSVMKMSILRPFPHYI